MWSVEDLDLIGKAFPSHIVNIVSRLEQRMRQTGETREAMIAEIRASYERSLHDEEHIPTPPRDEVQEQIDFIRWVVGDMVAAPVAAPVEEHKFPASLDEKLSDYAPVEEPLQTEDLLAMHATNELATEQTVQRLDRLKRKKFFELLNVELAELQQERGGPRENLKRESEIESLLGLFARVGEM